MLIGPICCVFWVWCLTSVDCVDLDRVPAESIGRNPVFGEDQGIVFEDTILDFETALEEEEEEGTGTFPVTIAPEDRSASDINVTKILGESYEKEISLLLPCAQIKSVSITSDGRMNVGLVVRTGGPYVSGCKGSVEITYIPLTGSTGSTQPGVGWSCPSGMSIRASVSEEFAYDSTLHCLEFVDPIYGSPDPLVLNYDFDVPVLENRLERVFINHRGDPHPETVPFTGSAFYADGLRAVPFDQQTAVEQNLEDLQNPDCFEFAAPGRFAYDPGRFDTENPRILESRLFAASSDHLAPMAAFPHRFEPEEDVFSVGLNGSVDSEPQFDMQWTKDPPLSPYLFSDLPALF